MKGQKPHTKHLNDIKFVIVVPDVGLVEHSIIDVITLKEKRTDYLKCVGQPRQYILANKESTINWTSESEHLALLLCPVLSKYSVADWLHNPEPIPWRVIEDMQCTAVCKRSSHTRWSTWQCCLILSGKYWSRTAHPFFIATTIFLSSSVPYHTSVHMP